MRLLACGACLLTGSLLLAGPVSAGKPAGPDPFQLDEEHRKSLVTPGSGGPRPASRLDRSDVARLMSAPTTLDAWQGRPYPALADDEGPRPVHPLFRRHYRNSGPLSGLDWRERGSFAGLKSRYEDLGNGLKSRIFGKNLADNVKIELDGSPEIEFEFEFD